MTQETGAAADEITVIDLADPQAVPMTVNRREPAPGYPVQAHADRLAGLLEAAFGLAAPVAEALRAGLRRAYTDGGWDMRPGAARPGAVTSPAVPSFRELKLAVLAAAGELGYGPGMRAQVRGFLEARLDALWGGPAGRFLEGGHPADPARLLRGNVLVTGSGPAQGEGGGAGVVGGAVGRIGAAGRGAGGRRPRPGLAPALGPDAGAGLPHRPAGAPGAAAAAARLARARPAAPRMPAGNGDRRGGRGPRGRPAALLRAAVPHRGHRRDGEPDAGRRRGPRPRRVRLGRPAASLAARDGAAEPARPGPPPPRRHRAAARLRPRRAARLAGDPGRGPAPLAAPAPAGDGITAPP